MNSMHRLLRKLEAKVNGRRKVEDSETRSEAAAEEDVRVRTVIGVSPISELCNFARWLQPPLQLPTSSHHHLPQSPHSTTSESPKGMPPSTQQTVPCQVRLFVQYSPFFVFLTIPAVSHGKDTRERHLRYREGGRAHQDRQILCLQSYQQETHGGPRTYGPSHFASCIASSMLTIH